jgi:hypothetical protein
MGTGKVDTFGIYGVAQGGGQTIVWSLKEATVTFPSACTYLILTSSTMGLDSYKLAISVLTAAKITGTPVRFYAHAERDGGCGVDYVQLV